MLLEAVAYNVFEAIGIASSVADTCSNNVDKRRRPCTNVR